MKSRESLFFYNLLLFFVGPLFLVFHAVRSIWRGKSLRGLGDRLGLSYGDLRRQAASRPILWIHAVSVGEVNAAHPLVRELRRRYPDLFILVTTVTPTGRAVLLQKMPEADATRFFPLDFPPIVAHAIQAVRPAVFVCLETEIWPNFFTTLHRHGIPSGIVNGRISPRSFRGYSLVRRFLRPVLAGVDFFGMQTEQDADRIRRMGACPDRITVMGNLKYDGAVTPSPDRLDRLRAELGIGTSRLWVAGSTHRGEEELILEAFRILVSEFPDLRLAIAPRHPERFEEVATLISREGIPMSRRSDACAMSRDWRTLLIDSMGELATFYGLADIAFVGGSLVPVGGHNVIEPAALGKPVVFGPHMWNFADVASRMKERGCGIEVLDAKDLAQRVRGALHTPEFRFELENRARAVVEENRGAVGRAVALIESLLPQNGTHESVGTRGGGGGRPDELVGSFGFAK